MTAPSLRLSRSRPLVLAAPFGRHRFTARRGRAPSHPHFEWVKLSRAMPSCLRFYRCLMVSPHRDRTPSDSSGRAKSAWGFLISSLFTNRKWWPEAFRTSAPSWALYSFARRRKSSLRIRARIYPPARSSARLPTLGFLVARPRSAMEEPSSRLKTNCPSSRTSATGQAASIRFSGVTLLRWR